MGQRSAKSVEPEPRDPGRRWRGREPLEERALRELLACASLHDGLRVLLQEAVRVSGSARGYLEVVGVDATHGEPLYVVEGSERAAPGRPRGTGARGVVPESVFFDNGVQTGALKSLLPPEAAPGAESLLAAPVGGPRGALAALWLLNRPGGFSAADREAIERLLTQTSVFLGRMATQEDLERDRARQEAALEAASGVAAIADARFALVSWNAAAERRLGWAAAEVLGKSLEAFLSGERGADGGHEEVNFRCRDGSFVTLWVRPLRRGRAREWLVTEPALLPVSGCEISLEEHSKWEVVRSVGMEAARDPGLPRARCYELIAGRTAPCPECALGRGAGCDAVVPSRVDPSGVTLFRQLRSGPSVVEVGAFELSAPNVTRALEVKLAQRFRRAGLTEREREIAKELLGGEGPEQVAARLGIAARTVRFHVAHVLEKVGADSRADLMRIVFS